MNAYTGNTFLPVLDHNPDGNYRGRMSEYPLGLGTMIVPCLVHLDLEDGDVNGVIFEVYETFIHIADAASLEAALAILSDKYNDSLVNRGALI